MLTLEDEDVDSDTGNITTVLLDRKPFVRAQSQNTSLTTQICSELCSDLVFDT
jgi:hypothetical protein